MLDSKGSTAKASKSVQGKNGFVAQCKTCRFPDHDKYDADCIQGKISMLDYAKLVGCSDKSIARHLSHIPQTLVKAANVEVITNADNLLDQIVYYETEARRFKVMAEDQGDIDLALKAVDRALKCIELFAKVRGVINEQPQITIINNPEYIEIRSKIIMALDPFPEAKEAVVLAIHGR